MQLDPQLDGQLSINDILLELGQAPVVHPSPDAASELHFFYARRFRFRHPAPAPHFLLLTPHSGAPALNSGPLVLTAYGPGG